MKAFLFGLLVMSSSAFAAKDCKIVAGHVASGILNGINELVGGPSSRFQQKELIALAGTKDLHIFQVNFENSMEEPLNYKIELANDPYLNCLPVSSSLIH